MTDYSTTFSVNAMVSIKYDDALGVLGIATDASYFQTWNPYTGSVRTTYMPVYMFGFDLTADGQYALIASGGPNYPSQVNRVSLSTMALEPLNYGAISTIGPMAVATTQSGIALGSSTAYPGVAKFSAEAATLSSLGVVWSPPVESPTEPFFETDLVQSENDRYVLIRAEQNLSPILSVDSGITTFPVATRPGALSLYDSLSDQIVATNLSAFSDHDDNYRVAQGSGDDVSEAAGMAAIVNGGQVDIFDLGLNLVEILNLSGRTFYSAHFSASGHQLFAWDAQNNDILVYDTQSWAQVGTIHAGTASDSQVAETIFSNFGQITTSADGRMLFLQDYIAGQGGVVDAIDLSARLHLTVNGDVTHTLLYGSVGADVIHGGAGNDLIDGYGGDDVLDGGAGTNTVSFAAAAAGVTVSLALQGQTQNTGGAGPDTLTNFQNLTGSSFNDTLIGDVGANVITGGGGNDVLTGGGGGDTLVMTVGGGSDTVTDFSHAQGDRIDLSAFASFPVLPDVLAASHQSGADAVITLGSGSLTLQGVQLSSLTAQDFLFSAYATTQIGAAGVNDHLVGGAGNDYLQGQGGNDILQGGGGYNYLDGGAGLDTAVYTGLSRAWCWRGIAAVLPPSDPARDLAQAAARRHLEAGLAHVEGDYMGEHWLASFALLALTAD